MWAALFFSSDPGFSNTAWWLPFIVVAYIFYYGSAWMSLGMIGLFMLTVSAFGGNFDVLTLVLSFLYFAILLFKRHTLRPRMVKKVAWAFFCIGIFYAYLQRGFWEFSGIQEWMKAAGWLCFNFSVCVLIWWFLEYPGYLIEERFFPSDDKDRQLDLFTVRQAKISGKLYPMKIQKRIRRRFGLKDGW